MGAREGERERKIPFNMLEMRDRIGKVVCAASLVSEEEGVCPDVFVSTRQKEEESRLGYVHPPPTTSQRPLLFPPTPHPSTSLPPTHLESSVRQSIPRLTSINTSEKS